MLSEMLGRSARLMIVRRLSARLVALRLVAEAPPGFGNAHCQDRKAMTAHPHRQDSTEFLLGFE